MSPRARYRGALVVLALAPMPYLAQAADAAPMTTDGAHAVRYCGPEDGPAWNWRRCGNHKRAIVTLAGRRLVVGPIRFDRIDDAFRIDWTATPKLRGDGPRNDVQNY